MPSWGAFVNSPWSSLRGETLPRVPAHLMVSGKPSLSSSEAFFSKECLKLLGSGGEGISGGLLPVL
jgi:hypothetical protein